jgi:hypothetical protein
MELSRREVLRGLGATVALPWLEAMAPTGRKPRLVCIENVHGAAGSSKYGWEQNLWAPKATGTAFDLSPTSLKPLERLRDHITIISNTDVPSADPTEAREIGGDHFRSSATWLTHCYPKRTEGADVEAGISLDQMYAQRFGQDTPIPSMQLCIENIDQSGGCGYGYSCAYSDSISWAAPNKPLPMVRDPRVVFDQMFNVVNRGSGGDDRSILDFVLRASARLKGRLGIADRARLNDYLDNVREMERRIQVIEARNSSGEPREFPAAPAGVPDNFAEHVALMFDLQLLAFTSDITRVFSFKLSRDASTSVYRESGSTSAFHTVSHHSYRPDRIRELALINTYHVAQVAKFIERLAATPDVNGTLLDNTLVMYGSPMGDPNQHNHKKVPFVLAGHAGGALKGGVHLQAPNATPLSNVMLSLLHLLGFTDLKSFGDSEGTFSLS